VLAAYKERGKRLNRAVIFAARCKRMIRRMRADSTKGSAAIEFAMVAPIFFALLMGTFEASIMFFSQAVLQNAVTEMAREIRTGQIQTGGISQSQFRTDICNMTAPLVPCNNNLQIDVESYSGASSISYAGALNSNGTLNTSLNNYATGSPCNVVLVRAFYTEPIYTPVLDWFLVNMSGNMHLITAASAFRNEPYTNTVAGC
jgi:Flp pilus assembly protein TadG